MTNSDSLPKIDFYAPLNLPDLTNSAFSEKRLARNRYLTFVFKRKNLRCPHKIGGGSFGFSDNYEFAENSEMAGGNCKSAR